MILALLLLIIADFNMELNRELLKKFSVITVQEYDGSEALRGSLFRAPKKRLVISRAFWEVRVGKGSIIEVFKVSILVKEAFRVVFEVKLVFREVLVERLVFIREVFRA